MNKRAQATAFVIIGLVLASIVILIFYFRAELLETLTKKSITEEPITEQSQKIDIYTKSCLSSTLEEGLLTLGMQGGFINIPEAEFPPLPYNMLSNSLDVFNKGTLRVPYWYYRTPNNLEKTNIPTINSMEQELASYIDARLGSCLNDFLPLKLQGFSISHSTPKTKIIIGNEEVIAELNMNVDVQYKDQTFTFSKFKSKQDSPLGNLYKKALEIFEYENEKTFIENTTLDFMAVYDQIPFTDIDFECSPRTWLKTKVAIDLKAILAANIPTMKIKSTEYSLTNPFDKVLVFDALDSSGRDTTVNFRFSESWPIMLDVVGEDNEILRGKPFTSENEASRFLMPLFCLNDYHFVYDIKFPVLISLAEQDYIFQFALMSIIDNNQPREDKAQFTLLTEDTRICENKPSKLKVISLGVSTDDSLIPLNDADISLQCLATECKMGKTRPEETGYSLTTNFPACINAQLTAKKQGYHRAKETIDTNQQATISLVLEPYYELPISVMVQDGAETRFPYPTEQVLFLFENQEKDYYTTHNYPSQQKVKLIAGNYKVSSTLTVQTAGGFNIEEEKINLCVDAPKKGVFGMFGATEKKCTEQTIEGTTFDALVSGGGSYGWYADRRALATSSKLTIYTVRGSTPSTLSEINKQYTETEEYSKQIRKPSYE